MSDDLRSISIQTIPDAIRIMNGSSDGTSLEYHLDFFSFLSLQGYWNFSSAHSLIRYVDGEAAAIILACTDPDSHEAYILYWGTLPKFRTRKIAQSLFEACCQRLFAAGYVMLYGVSVPDRPVRRYRFIQAAPEFNLFDMEARTVTLPAADARFEIRNADVAVISRIQLPAGERLHWSQRPAFLNHAASRMQIFGAFEQGTLKAYAVVLPGASNGTELVDLRSSTADVAAGIELLRHVFTSTYSPPFTATHVFDKSYSHQLLCDAGFAVSRRFCMLTRDLRATCSAPGQLKTSPQSELAPEEKSSPRAAS
jgi:Acetyltransferase (GNAT) family